MICRMIRRPGVLAAALVLLGLGSARAADPPAAPHCPLSRLAPLDLPRTRAALRANQEVTIVALGSSSTEGVQSSDIAHSYPALLQSMLNVGLPSSHVAVLNRGVGGQDVAEMLPRIERDVLGVRPTLVIWQVGANGAMKHMPPELFKRLLTTGVQRLREARVDIVLMDNQRAPAIMATPDHNRFDRAMAEVAANTGVPLFDRGALMDTWRAGGRPYEEFMSADGVHHNDHGYRCVSEALAQTILDGLSTNGNGRVVDRSPR